MANTIIWNEKTIRKRKFNSNHVCYKCTKYRTSLCVLAGYKKGFMKSCSGFKKYIEPVYEGKSITENAWERIMNEKNNNKNICNKCIKKNYHMCPRFFKERKNICQCIAFLRDNRKDKGIAPWFISTLKKKEGDFYEKYIDKKEEYIWEKIIKEKRANKIEIFGGIKKMNEINNLKQKIKNIKEKRNELINKAKEIYKSDAGFGTNKRISKQYLVYLDVRENLSEFIILKTDKKGNIKKKRTIHSSEYTVLKHIEIGGNPPSYYIQHWEDHPLSKNMFDLIDANSKDWIFIEKVLNYFIKNSDFFLKSKYEGELKRISKASDYIVCEACGIKNKITGNYCNNCGKTL